MNSISNCMVCGNALSGKQRSFCSIECKNDHFLNYDALKARALERKTRLIASFGGGCARCGYSASLDALSFYDLNSETLHVDTNVLANSNYGKLLKKLENAQVLCKNCVEEVHSAPSSSSLVANPGISLGPSEGDPRIRKDDVGGVGMTTGVGKKFTKNLVSCGVKPGQTIVLGVSGGVDSVTMLDLFSKSMLKLNVIVAHMNHGVRLDAINDERLVIELAKSYGFEYVTTNLTNEKHTNILENVGISNNQEEYLRDARRKFLLDAANGNGADFVALAHNANDQAETFILNAVRGSGPAGLGAMSMSEDLVIRPLLNLSRAEIESYANQNKLIWHEDVTNKDTSYDRNYVRHNILPLLTRLNPEYLSAIGRTAHLQRRIDEHLKEEAYRIITNYKLLITNQLHNSTISKSALIRNSKLEIRNSVMSASRMRHLDKSLLYEVIGLLYEEAKGDRKNLSLAHISAVESLIKSSEGTKTLNLPGNVIAKRSYDSLDFSLKKEHNTSSTISTQNLKIGTQRFGDWKFTVSPTPLSSRLSLKASGEIPQGILRDSSSKVGMTGVRNEIVIDAEMLPNIQLRTKLPGDKIAKLGLNGTKKLQDLFVDAKIDRVQRSTWPILEDITTGQILWVTGLAKAKIAPITKKLLTIKIERRNDKLRISNFESNLN